MERVTKIVNAFQPLTIFAKRCILEKKICLNMTKENYVTYFREILLEKFFKKPFVTFRYCNKPRKGFGPNCCSSRDFL